MSNTNENINVKLYPIYKMFSFDVLFFYAIIFLFLTQAKGLSASEVLLADAFYPLFKLFLAPICTAISSHIGKRQSILIANISISFGILILLIGKGFFTVVFMNLFFAVGYTLKALCDTTILYNSIKDSKLKNHKFSKIDSRGSVAYYFLDSISSIFTGFFFVFNPYLPIIISFIFSLIAIMISFAFIEPNVENFRKNKKSFKRYIKEIINSTKFIFNSKRLRGLLLYYGAFAGLLSVMKPVFSSLLLDLNISEVYFGFFTAFMQIIAAISSYNQSKIHNTFRNKTLTVFATSIISLSVVTGLFIVCSLPNWIIFISCMLLFTIYGFVKGLFYILIKRYFNSFTTSSIDTKIFGASVIIESIFTIIIYLFSSYLLSITTTAYALIVLSCTLGLIFIMILDYMKTRVGLKPEEYNKSDIEYVELK